MDYYRLLGINRKTSEEQLNAILDKQIKEIRKLINDGTVKDKAFGNLAIVLCEHFKKTLKRYGSKEKYDDALKKKYSKKVNVNKNFKFDKKVAGKLTKYTALAGIVFVGITIPSTLTTVEVPVYDGDTIEMVCEYYGVPTPAMVSEGLAAHFNGFTEDGSVRIITSRIKAHEIREKVENVKIGHKKETEPVKTYGFYYIVKSGDTASGLKEKYDLVDAPNRGLNIDEELWLVTKNPDIAEEMKKQYEIDMAKPEPTEYEYYEVQPGDNLGTIAEKFGVSTSTLVDFNNISNPQSIYVGQEIIIVYEYVTGEEAIALREQKQESNKSLS